MELFELQERLKNLDEQAFNMIEGGIQLGNYQALEIFMKYRYAEELEREKPEYKTGQQPKPNGIQTKGGYIPQ